MNGVYGNGVYSRQIVSNPNVVELPMAPIRQRPATMHHPCTIDWKTYGIILSLLAAASLALGVADVVYTYQTYMIGKSCSTNTTPAYCNTNVLVFTWIAVGIWASVPVFFYGLEVLRHSGAAVASKSMCMELLVFLCTFVFTPAMIVISAIEVWKGVNVFYWTANGLPSDDTVKAALPISIAVLGFIEWLMCAVALYYCCCCQHTMASASTVVTSTNTYQPQPVMVQSATYERPGCQPCAARQALPAPAPSCQPCASKQSFYSAGGIGGGMGMGGGMGGGCSSCPRPMSYNNYGGMSPNPAYNFYRS